MVFALFAKLAAVRALAVAVVQSVFQIAWQLLAGIALDICGLRGLDSSPDFLERRLVAFGNKQRDAVLGLAALVIVGGRRSLTDIVADAVADPSISLHVARAVLIICPPGTALSAIA